MSGRLAYDIDASGQVQSNLAGIIGRLESLIAARDSQVKAALSDFSATGVSEEYRAVEARWNGAAQQVREIIALLRSVMEKNDGHAHTALSQASSAVANIG